MIYLNQVNKRKLICLFLITNIFLISVSQESVLGLSDTKKILGASALHSAGITGKDQTICIIDDGVDYTHLNLGECTVTTNINDGSCGKVIGGYDFADNDNNPYPTDYHGTKVAGIIGSNHVKYTGIAKDAKIVAIKIFSDYQENPSEFEIWSRVEKGIKWCVDNRTTLNISVISASLGDMSYTNIDCPDLYGNNITGKVQEAINKGIAVIFASGNEYSNEGINFPSCVGNVTSVGSVNKEDEISSYGNLGNNLDLLAPGDYITTTKKGDGFTVFKEWLCELGISTTHCTIGTSFATPHVSGAFALIKQYDPALKPRDIEKLLKDSGKRVYDSATGLTFPRIDLLSALNVLDWPTGNHDYRRTSATLLKGDMSKKEQVEQFSFVLESNITQEQVLKPLVADVDADGIMETITFVHNITTDASSITTIYSVENKMNKVGSTYKPKTSLDWARNISGGAVYFPGTLANLDGDIQKELVTGVWNGTVYVFDISSNGKASTPRWNYQLRKKWSPLAAVDAINFGGGNVIEDIDLDGNKEIILADTVYNYDPDWPGEVYVLKDNGPGNQPTKFANYTFGNGGAYAPISVANIDGDDNPEIIVPSRYGVYVLDYDASAQYKLTKKWNNNDGKIESSPVIVDVDNDNKYEIVYSTWAGEGCASGKTCYNRIYVRDAETGNLERQIDVSTLPRPTPAVANLDSDPNLEIAVIMQDKVGSLMWDIPRGNVSCYDAVTGNLCGGSWPFNLNHNLRTAYMSPSIADIDNDGIKDIVFAENDGNRVFVLKNNGAELFNYSFEGFIDNGIALSDVDKDGVAEFTLKRAGSPITILSTLSSFNKPPFLKNIIPNITAIAGDSINLNATGEMDSADLNIGDTIQFSYNAPFNSSGLWQTTVNDSGNYTVLIEVNDGNLSTYQYLDLIVFPEHTQMLENFTDNSSKKVLDYTASVNKSVQIRLPKDAVVIYSKITLTGGSP